MELAPRISVAWDLGNPVRDPGEDSIREVTAWVDVVPVISRVAARAGLVETGEAPKQPTDDVPRRRRPVGANRAGEDSRHGRIVVRWVNFAVYRRTVDCIPSLEISLVETSVGYHDTRMRIYDYGGMMCAETFAAATSIPVIGIGDIRTPGIPTRGPRAMPGAPRIGIPWMIGSTTATPIQLTTTTATT